MRFIKLISLALVAVFFLGSAPEPAEADCTDCYLAHTPWGMEWVCLDLGEDGYRVCAEFGGGDGCLLLVAC